LDSRISINYFSEITDDRSRFLLGDRHFSHADAKNARQTAETSSMAKCKEGSFTHDQTGIIGPGRKIRELERDEGGGLGHTPSKQF
jgi:hypothetical protein